MKRHCKACQATDHWTKDCSYGYSAIHLFTRVGLGGDEVEMALGIQLLRRAYPGSEKLRNLAVRLHRTIQQREATLDYRASIAVFRVLDLIVR